MKEVYAFKNSLEEVIRSSSGGAYIAFCNGFEKKFGKGNVAFYGVTFDSEMNVIHSRVEKAEKCNIFQGSKYVKSKFDNILCKVESDLKIKKYVLFSGTPCQIFSLKTFLQNRAVSQERLYCIDIICHGTPSHKFWEDYKKWLEIKQNSKLIKYSFRYKPEGWKAYPAYAEFENGKKLINTTELSIYSKLQMIGFITTKGCFKCQFSNENRVGDITLGDYWGIETISPQIEYKNGVSLLILNSQKGLTLLDYIKDENPDVELVKTETNDYIKYQNNLQKATVMPQNYDEFWEDYIQKGFDFVLKKYLNYGTFYSIKFIVKKFLRKTPIIEIYRKIKNKGIV